jgi:hypothetical protein
MVRETEMSSQLRVLTLIHEVRQQGPNSVTCCRPPRWRMLRCYCKCARGCCHADAERWRLLLQAGDDEIFPPAIMIKASPFQSETSQRKAATRHDAAPKEMMLFGPLVQMMRDRLLDDKKTREQLVNDVLQRRVAASDRQIQAVARISGVWREKQKARSSRQSQQTRDSGASEEPPTVEQRAATSPEALAVADSAASEEPPTVEHRAATSPDHLAVATASSNGQDDSSELDLVI